MAKKKKQRKSIRLGVNVDHIATLRQVRGGETEYPNLIRYVRHAVQAGADQITIHLREDRRHIQDHDLKLLSKKCPVALNLEMAATEKMVQIAKKYKPDWVCLVPEKRQELTTEGGLDLVAQFSKISAAVRKLRNGGIRVSPFIDPTISQVRAAIQMKVHAVEFHTGHWVLAKGKKRKMLLRRLQECCRVAKNAGLQVHAGHGLDFKSTKELLKIPK